MLRNETETKSNGSAPVFGDGCGFSADVPKLPGFSQPPAVTRSLNFTLSMPALAFGPALILDCLSVLDSCACFVASCVLIE